MLDSNQQKEIEDVVVWLEVLEHPIEQIFTSAKDFKNPSKKTIELYTEAYCTYPVADLYEIRNFVSEIVSIRDVLDKDLQELWFDFDVNNLYEGLLYFQSFLSELIDSMSRTNSHYDEEKDEWIEEDQEINVAEISQSCYNIIGMVKKERELHKAIGNTILEMRALVLNRDTKIDMDELIQWLNATFKSCGLMNNSENEIAQIKTEPYFYTPYISERISFSIESRNWSRWLHINWKLNILFNILKFLQERDKFYEKMDIFQPTSEMFEQLEADKKVYWAKWAHLRFLKTFSEKQKALIEAHLTKSTIENILWIKALLEWIQDINEENAWEIFKAIEEKTRIEHIEWFEFQLLPSIEVDIELYKSWKSWVDIDIQIKTIYEDATKKFYAKQEISWEILDDNGKRLPSNAHWLIVRSSAVNSEDNEQTSWAGIYESVWEVHSFDDFKKAVEKVFQSVESKRAIAHRREYEIKEEFMWLVIMPHINTSNEYLGYANTSRIWKPHLMDIKDLNWKLATVQKDLLPVDFKTEMHFWSFISQLYNVDTWNDEGFKINELWLPKNLPLMFFMEQYFWKPLQFEFVSSSWGRMNDDVYIVQMRPLNYWDAPTDIPEFPEEKHIYEWKCVIPWDITLKKNNLLIRKNSWEATLSRWFRGRSLLDDISNWAFKAVIITDGFSNNNNAGHIETLCTEKWIICVCNDPLNENDMNINFERYEKIRIISDGEIARIYPVV